MAEFLSIEVTGADELRAELQRAIQRLQQPHELMEAIGASFVANIERRFDTKKDPNGVAWDKLRPATLERYREEDTNKQGVHKHRGTILERTGRMRDSLAYNAGDDYVEIGMTRLTDGGRWQIPLLHETGTRRMARRGLFTADPDAGTLGAGDEADLLDEIRGFLDDVFGA